VLWFGGVKNQRVRHDGERSLILNWMGDLGLIYDLAQPEDPREAVRDSVRFFQRLAAWLLEKRLVFPEEVQPGVDVSDWNEIPMIPDRALEIHKASRSIGFLDGVLRGYAALRISAYYSKYPERLLIAKYIRKRHDANPKEICEYVDVQEDIRISSLPPALMHIRPYPLPWEAAPLERRVALTKQSLEHRTRWADALDKKKHKDLGQVKRLRSFLSKEKAIALRDEDAQMYFAWTQWSAGKVLSDEYEGGSREVTFGDLAVPMENIDAYLPEILRMGEASHKMRGSSRVRRPKECLEDL